jgi:hypothetical protein
MRCTMADDDPLNRRVVEQMLVGVVLRKNSGRDLLRSVIVVQATQTGAGNNAVRAGDTR